ncbi:MAG: PIG-L deacetylase family protein [Ignavibacteria bacterium]
MSKVILAVSAHPDDIEFSCGGTMFKYKEKGYNIYFVVATNGENGFKIGHKARNERIRIRLNEQLKAAKKLGVKKVFFLNYRDCFLENSAELRAKLVKIIKKVRPEMVFTFDPANKSFESINLNHRDHRVIAESVFDAVFAARNRYVYPGESMAVKYFYFFGTNNPNHFENITKFIEKKIDLIGAHRSQYNDYLAMAEWVKKHLSKYTKKYKYSEKFRIVEITKPFVLTGAENSQ